MLFSYHFIHSVLNQGLIGEKVSESIVRVFENLLGAINFQNFWGVCNVEGIQRVVSILGFRTCVPLVADRSNVLKFRLARSTLVVVTRGVRFGRYGNFTGTSPCYLHGIDPVLPIVGIKSVSSLPIPMNFLPQKLQNVRLACQQW